MKIAFVVDKIGLSIPLGLAYLSSALKSSGFEVKVFAAGRNYRDMAALLDFCPGIIGYSVITGSQKRYLEINRFLKEKLRFYSVFGGPHATFFPRIIQEEGVDAVCRGESEWAMLDLAKFIERDRELPQDLENFWLKKGDKIFENPPRDLVDNLDTLPFPDRRIFLEKFGHLRILGRLELIAHRGCPHTCSYCFNPAFNHLYKNKGRVYRSRSPGNICEEIRASREYYDLKFVHFVDDLFTLDINWLREFSAIYSRGIGLPFSINTRLDNCSGEVASLLKQANCRLVYAGVESGNDYLRNNLMQRCMATEKIKSGMESLKKEGIKVLTENIIGLPQESYKSSLETLGINALLKPDFANASIFTPYPGLKLTEYALGAGQFSGNFNDIPPVYYRASSLKPKDGKDLNRILNLRCFFSFLSRHPRYISLFNALSFIKHNRFFRMIGDLLDGYYLYRLLPFSLGRKNIFRLTKVYVSSYRN